MTAAVISARLLRQRLRAVCWRPGDTNFDRLSLWHHTSSVFYRPGPRISSGLQPSSVCWRRLCALDYVYFASLYDVCTQNELAFLRAELFWLAMICGPQLSTDACAEARDG